MNATKTTIAYVDGFNFYHGAVKGNPGYKWLNLPAFCSSLVPQCNLLLVRYYTARVSDWPTDPTQSQRQDVYLRALATLPRMEIIHGLFRTRTKRVRLLDGSTAQARVTEEKGSDVNLGADLVWDACHGNMTCALIISNDFDLQHPVKLAMQLGIEVLVANPHRHSGQRASVNGTGTRNIRKHHMVDGQLPNPVVDASGREIHRPGEW